MPKLPFGLAAACMRFKPRQKQSTKPCLSHLCSLPTALYGFALPALSAGSSGLFACQQRPYSAQESSSTSYASALQALKLLTTFAKDTSSATIKAIVLTSPSPAQ